MDEADWMNSTNIEEMIWLLWGRASLRKLRLFAVACSRLLWKFMDDERSQTAILTAERYADRLVSRAELYSAYNSANSVSVPRQPNGFPPPQHFAAWAAASSALEMGGLFDDYQSARLASHAARADCIYQPVIEAEVRLLHDIFDSLFLGIEVDPLWLTPNIVRLAQTVYDGKVFDRMTTLGDALEAAGCDDPDILAHCRSQTEHVRGCWVVDAILGKS